MTVEDQPESSGSLPLVGWIFHAIVRFGFLGGAALAGWSMGDGGVRGLGMGALFAMGLGSLWALTYAQRDPDARRWARIRVPGRVRLSVELIIIVIGGVAIWLYWNRAAAETYYTLAAFDYSVQYRRIVTMYQSR